MGVKGFFEKLMYGGDDSEINEDAYDAENDEIYDGENNYAEEKTARSSGDTRTESHAAPSKVNITTGSSIEMKVVKPERLDSVTQIADHLLDRKTILLNLEETNKETARRLIDFLNGVAYAISGSLKKVANNTYVITPSNVDVSGDQLRDPQDKGDLF